jgi:hypothetical protein
MPAHPSEKNKCASLERGQFATAAEFQNLSSCSICSVFLFIFMEGCKEEEEGLAKFPIYKSDFGVAKRHVLCQLQTHNIALLF